MKHKPGIPLAVLLLVALLPAGPTPQTSARPPGTWQITCIDCPKLIDNLTDRSLHLDAAGHPHVAYGGDHLYYAWHDGTSWVYETADISAGVGRFASLDLGQDGQPHVAYYDSRMNRLLYAYRAAARWQVEIVDTEIATSGLEMTSFSLALDPSGQPHVAYKRNEGLHYASRQAGTRMWQIESVDPATGDFASLALDAAGRPHISYGGIVLKHAFRDTSGWHIEVVDANMSSVFGGGSLALDSAGYPHISYRSIGALWGLVYAHSDANGWHKELVVEADASDSALTLDANDSPHISYTGHGQGPELHYARRLQSDWQIDAIDHSDQPNWRYRSSVAVDGSGRARILYHGSIGSFSAELDRRLAYAQAGPAGWQIDSIDNDGVAGIGVSLALDAGGYPHLSYQGTGLKRAYLDATGWHVETLDTLGAGDTSLVLDTAGQLRVAYTAYYDNRNWSSTGPVEVKVGREHAAGWQAEIVDRAWNYGPNASLALTPDGWPGIAYSYGAYPYSRLCYGHQDAAGWHIDRVDTSMGSVSSLAIGADGVPRIAYQGNGLRYVVRSATGWQAETVATQADVPDAISLALDNSGAPHIAYYQSTSSTDGDLKYARRDAAGWHVETVDAPGDVGRAASLVLDASGSPHIAYFDKTHQDMKYATKNATGWHVEAVDDDGDVGQATSIALDAGGYACIGYYDAGLADLKLACQVRREPS